MMILNLKNPFRLSVYEKNISVLEGLIEAGKT